MHTCMCGVCQGNSILPVSIIPFVNESCPTVDVDRKNLSQDKHFWAE